MWSPFDQMPKGMFNPGVAGFDAARKANEESQLRQVEKQGNLSVIAQRLQKMRDFEEARKSRLAKYGYDENYYNAKAPLAGEEAGYDVSKKKLDNDTASFDLRKKRSDLMRTYMPAIMRMRDKDPQMAARMYNRLFGQNGLYGPGAGMSMDEAGAATDWRADRKYQQDLGMESARRATAAAGRSETQKNWREQQDYKNATWREQQDYKNTNWKEQQDYKNTNWKEQQDYKSANKRYTVETTDDQGNKHLTDMTGAEYDKYKEHDTSARVLGEVGTYNPTSAENSKARADLNRAKGIVSQMRSLVPPSGKITPAQFAQVKTALSQWRTQAATIEDPAIQKQITDNIDRIEENLPALEEASKTGQSFLLLMQRYNMGPQSGGTSSNGFRIKTQ